MTGFTEKGKNTGIVIDDKYPSSPRWIQGLTPTYKIQLSAYAVALENSDNYGRDLQSSRCAVEVPAKAKQCDTPAVQHRQ